MKITFPFFKKSQKKVDPRNSKVKKKREFILRLCLAIFIIASLTSIYISLASRSSGWIEYSFPDLNEGDISPRGEIAPFDFNVPKTEKQLATERNIAARNVLPVFRLEETIFDSVNARIDTLFSIIDSLSSKDVSDSVGRSLILPISQELSYSEVDSMLQIVKKGDKSLAGNINKAMKESFKNIFELLIVPGENYVTNITDDLFVLDNGDTVNVEMTIEVDEAGDLLKNTFQGEIGGMVSENDIITLQNIIRRFLKPNLIYDNKLTSELRRRASDTVPLYSASFKEN